MIKFSHKMRVEFYDVDSMNVVWHGNYVKFLEAARCAFLREIGYEYQDFARKGYALPVVKMEFKFIRPAFFGDEIEVSVCVSDCMTLLNLDYEISSRAELLCKAKTSQACVHIDTRTTMFELPSGFYEALKRYEERK